MLYCETQKLLLHNRTKWRRLDCRGTSAEPRVYRRGTGPVWSPLGAATAYLAYGWRGRSSAVDAVWQVLHL